MTYTDRTGRTAGDRIAAVQRTTPLTAAEQEAAARLLDDLLRAAAGHRVTLDDLDWTVDLPGGCVDVILARRP